MSDITTLRTKETNTDFEVRSLDTIYAEEQKEKEPLWSYLKYLFVGILFGIILVKSEVISWFRIRKCFAYKAFTCMV